MSNLKPKANPLKKYEELISSKLLDNALLRLQIVTKIYFNLKQQ